MFENNVRPAGALSQLTDDGLCYIFIATDFSDGKISGIVYKPEMSLDIKKESTLKGQYVKVSEETHNANNIQYGFDMLCYGDLKEVIPFDSLVLNVLGHA